MPAHLTDSASIACHSASLCLCALLAKCWLSTPLISCPPAPAQPPTAPLSTASALPKRTLNCCRARLPDQTCRSSPPPPPVRRRICKAHTSKMTTIPWEVLSKYAARYRIPKRGPDGRFRDPSELAADILEQEQRRRVLSNGCFFVEKRFGFIIERTTPLQEYPCRHRSPPTESAPAA